MQHWFIVPALDGPPSGGTLYNRELLSELSPQGAPVAALEPTAAARALAAGTEGCYWLDSLFLERFEALSRENPARRPLGLIAHYLPSLVEHGDGVSPAQLSGPESFALRHAAAALAPSAYMQRALIRLGLAHAERSFVVEPGCYAQRALPGPAGGDGVRALLVANVTPGKGVAPFLRALGAALSARDELELGVAGSLDQDRSYALSCQELVRTEPSLARRVRFLGRLTPQQVVAELSSRNLLISASSMESFGMAIAEARTLGVPVAARAGGNTAALVDAAAGGTLVDDVQALARACVALARDREAHARAAELALRHARPPRSFATAAREFSAQVNQLPGAGFAAGA